MLTPRAPPHVCRLWTHHEKIVIIDRKIAFLGGLDISFGRWDTGGHPIVDPDRRWFPQSVEYYQPAVAGEERAWVKGDG